MLAHVVPPVSLDQAYEEFHEAEDVHSSGLAAFIDLVESDPVTNYVDCGSKGGKIVSVDIVPACGDERYCILQSGKTVKLAWTIQATEALKSLQAKVYGTIAGIPVPFPLPNSNACKDSGISCPVKDGDTFTYDLNLDVKSAYPKIHVDVKFTLVEDGKTVACFLLPSKIE
ncbi:unnamed protein product [Notodromas monacha]|uniref:MD-2-related lipid-recognition domain-containing protein n=1 Tax=Notodromas monacha TaxID=399045 RepID=A0A7R9BGB5_9CRUS|nr:unnamed protein product [Notodromas monacha]CAG0913591.1 unnamed protein product [Notodromas monacha]